MEKGPRTLSGSSVNEISCYCPRGCGGNIPYTFDYKGCNILVYGCWWSSATHITEDARPKMIDAHFQDGVGSISLSLFTIQMANTLFVTVYNLLPPKLLLIHHQQLLTLHWHSFSGCSCACISVLFDHHGGQYIQNIQRRTNVNIWHLTVAYLIATLNNETENAQPEIWTDRSSQSRPNPCIDRYGSGFAPRTGSRSGCWSWYGTQLPCLCDPNPDHWQLTPTRC